MHIEQVPVKQQQIRTLFGLPVILTFDSSGLHLRLTAGFLSSNLGFYKDRGKLN